MANQDFDRLAPYQEVKQLRIRLMKAAGKAGANVPDLSVTESNIESNSDSGTVTVAQSGDHYLNIRRTLGENSVTFTRYGGEAPVVTAGVAAIRPVRAWIAAIRHSGR